MRLSGRTYIPAVEQQPVMGFGALFGRYVFQQNIFNLMWSVCGGRYKTKTVTDAVDMSVYGNCGLAKSNVLYNISRLTAYARQQKKALGVGRHFTAKPLRQHSGRLNQM